MSNNNTNSFKINKCKTNEHFIFEFTLFKSNTYVTGRDFLKGNDRCSYSKRFSKKAIDYCICPIICAYYEEYDKCGSWNIYLASLQVLCASPNKSDKTTVFVLYNKERHNLFTISNSILEKNTIKVTIDTSTKEITIEYGSYKKTFSDRYVSWVTRVLNSKVILNTYCNTTLWGGVYKECNCYNVNILSIRKK